MSPPGDARALICESVSAMRYFVQLDPAEAPIQVDVTELPDSALEVKIDGKPVDVDVVALGSALSVRVDGKMCDLTTEGTPPDIGAIASGSRAIFSLSTFSSLPASAW